MTAKEIRALQYLPETPAPGTLSSLEAGRHMAEQEFKVSREIAAQLAELNANIESVIGVVTAKTGEKYTCIITQKVLDRVVPA
jgi:hypothetical protein